MSMTQTRFYAGQRVRFVNTAKYNGRTATVIKQLPKNVDVRLDNGDRIRANPYFLEAVTDADGIPEIAPRIVDLVPPPLEPGTCVRVAESEVKRHPELAGFWIVCGGQNGKSRLFRLNNTNGRYWRVPNQHLIRVDGARIIVEMEDES